ncbi:MAG: hypothetical protein ACRDL7_06800, partial [Gaiellaceae bacterium]
VGITYSTQTGNYLIIGPLVWINLKIVLTSKGSSTGTAQIATNATGFTTNLNTERSVCIIENGTYVGQINVLTASASFTVGITKTGTALAAASQLNFNDNSVIYITILGERINA